MMSVLLTAISIFFLFDPIPISNLGWHRKASWYFKLWYFKALCSSNRKAWKQ